MGNEIIGAPTSSGGKSPADLSKHEETTAAGDGSVSGEGLRADRRGADARRRALAELAMRQAPSTTRDQSDDDELAAGLEALHQATIADWSAERGRAGAVTCPRRAPARGPGRLDQGQRDMLKKWRRHQKRYLPPALAILVTDAEAAALMALLRNANSEGRVSFSLTEWSARAKAPESTMKAVRASLMEKGLLGRLVGRRTGIRLNDQNSYYLMGEALRAVHTMTLAKRDQEVSAVAPQGAKVSPPKEESSESDSIKLSASATATIPSTKRTQSQPKGIQSKAAPSGSAATASICPPTAYALDLAKDACTEALPDSPAPRTADEVWKTVEAIRASLMPSVKDSLWRWILKKRGWNAGLAVIETAILHQAGHIHSPAAYWWGIVKPTSECAPAITVGKIVVHRRARGLMNTETKVNWPAARAQQLSMKGDLHAARS